MAFFYRILPWLITVWMLFAIYWYTCELHYHNCSCLRKRPPIPDSYIMVNTDTLLRFDKPLTFKSQQSDLPISTTQQTNIDAVAHYLLQNPKQQLKITAYHTADETPQLAQQRAQTLRNLFIKQLQHLNKIETGNRILLDSLVFTQIAQQDQPIIFQDTLFNAIQMVVIPQYTLDEARIQQLLTDTLRLTFEKKYTKFTINEYQLQYFQQLKQLTEVYPHKKIYLVGHADNDDSYTTNIKLGRKRAEIIQQLLLDIGISSSKIIVDSRGENQPIDDNSTSIGQQHNRRVDIFVR